MSILSVNVSFPKVVEHRGGTVQTGIFKDPLAADITRDDLSQRADGAVHDKAPNTRWAIPRGGSSPRKARTLLTTPGIAVTRPRMVAR